MLTIINLLLCSSAVIALIAGLLLKRYFYRGEDEK